MLSCSAQALKEPPIEEPKGEKSFLTIKGELLKCEHLKKKKKTIQNLEMHPRKHFLQREKKEGGGATNQPFDDDASIIWSYRVTFVYPTSEGPTVFGRPEAGNCTIG